MNIVLPFDGAFIAQLLRPFACQYDELDGASIFRPSFLFSLSIIPVSFRN
jgi:hypothetical protein